MKLKKGGLAFLGLYLLVLYLAGASRMKDPDTFLFKLLNFLWGLAPSQTFGWVFISLIVLVILLVSIFLVGCRLIARF
jgi:hypothetical protein